MTLLSLAFCLLTLLGAPPVSPGGDNADPDAILGVYLSHYKGDSYKVRITRNDNGTYRAQVIWVLHDINPETGEKWLDVRNPDKRLRSVPTDRIVLIDQLRHNPSRQLWDGAKIYDPLHGLRVSVHLRFLDDGRLAVRGSVMGIGQTIYWERIEYSAGFENFQ